MVVYDSVFGNTERIAQEIGHGLGSQEDVLTLRADNVSLEQLQGLDILVVGSPTRRFRPTAATVRLLKSIPADGLRGVKVAAFDTRIPADDIAKSRILSFLVRLFGYAAEPIADRLRKKGGELVVSPEGFFVQGTEGPLREGERERAADWARRIAAAA